MDLNGPPPPTAVQSITANDRSQVLGTHEPIGNFDGNVQINSNPGKKSVMREKWNSFVNHIEGIVEVFAGIFRFRFPIQQPPINFFRPIDHSCTGKRKSLASDYNPLAGELSPEILEVKVNFRNELFERYREVIEERLEAKGMNSPTRVDEMNLSDFPGWSRAVFLRLRSLFHIFDRGGDGLVDFNEFANSLDEYGDETAEHERRFHFEAADLESIGSIDFEQFLKMMYNLTMKSGGQSGGPSAEPHRVVFSTPKKKEVLTDSGHSNPTSDTDGSEEMALTSLGTSLRQIDRNMSRVKSLDVVQQLQAGLF